MTLIELKGVNSLIHIIISKTQLRSHVPLEFSLLHKHAKNLGATVDEGPLPRQKRSPESMDHT